MNLDIFNPPYGLICHSKQRARIKVFSHSLGQVPPFAPGMLGPKGSVHLMRQALSTHIASRESTQAMADNLFDIVDSGKVHIRID
jgi:NADPH:quinone reductase